VSFDVLIGQETAIETFQNALAKDRLAHTYMIVGPEGVGKRTFAREAARTLLCKKGGVDACDSCSSCRRIPFDWHIKPHGSARPERVWPDLNHSDFEWVEPIATKGRKTSAEKAKDASGRQITVEQALIFQNNLQLKPFESRCKVAVIGGCDVLRDEAANSLLKFLEEPPPSTIIFLTTSRPDRVLGTIVSRCQIIRMTALGNADVATILRTRFGIEEAQADRLAEASDGSVSRALWLASDKGQKLRLLALDIIRQGPSLDEEGSATTLGSEFRRMGLAEGIRSRRPLNEYVRRRAKEVLAFIASFYNDICRFHTTGKVSEASDKDWEAAVREWANEFQCDDALQAVNFALEAAGYIDQNVDVELVLGNFLRRSAKRRSRLPA